MKTNPTNIQGTELTKTQIADRVSEMHMHLRSIREACEAIEKSLKPTEGTFLTKEDFKDLCTQIEVSGEIMKKDFPNLY
jgi:hypothetical protein